MFVIMFTRVLASVKGIMAASYMTRAKKGGDALAASGNGRATGDAGYDASPAGCCVGDECGKEEEED